MGTFSPLDPGDPLGPYWRRHNPSQNADASAQTFNTVVHACVTKCKSLFIESLTGSPGIPSSPTDPESPCQHIPLDLSKEY